MDRRDIIISGLDLSKLQGLEIGPLSKPLVSSREGRVIYVDHTDTTRLKAKYEGNPYYDLNDFVTVDAVWNKNTLRDAVGKDFSADYIIASHVIEHVPNLVRWLQELHSVLSSSGEIRLAIPDKRFAFDHYRQVTQLSEVLASWILDETVPGPQAIINYQTRTVPVEADQIWRGEAVEPPAFSAANTRKAIEAARCAVETKHYEDVHCWVFTPRAFCEIMENLASLGLTNLECGRFIDTPDFGMEFYADLRPCENQEQVIASWREPMQNLRSGEFISIGRGGERTAQDPFIDLARFRALEQANKELVLFALERFGHFDINRVLPVIEYRPEILFKVTQEFLTKHLWKYYILNDPSPPATIQFVSNGKIGIYSHPNETAWKLEDDELTFFHASGCPSVRFDQVLEIHGNAYLRGRYLFGSTVPILCCLEQWS